MHVNYAVGIVFEQWLSIGAARGLKRFKSSLINRTETVGLNNCSILSEIGPCRISLALKPSMSPACCWRGWTVMLFMSRLIRGEGFPVLIEVSLARPINATQQSTWLLDWYPCRWGFAICMLMRMNIFVKSPFEEKFYIIETRSRIITSNKANKHVYFVQFYQNNI